MPWALYYTFFLSGHGFLKIKNMSLRGALPGTERRAVCRSSLPFNEQKLASGDCIERESKAW
jgi:hypothetical protein